MLGLPTARLGRRHAAGDRNRAVAVELYTRFASVYTVPVSKHLVDLDEHALREARAELGTASIRDTVNEALRRAGGSRQARVAKTLKVLASVELEDRAQAWR